MNLEDTIKIASNSERMAKDVAGLMDELHKLFNRKSEDEDLTRVVRLLLIHRTLTGCCTEKVVEIMAKAKDADDPAEALFDGFRDIAMFLNILNLSLRLALDEIREEGNPSWKHWQHCKEAINDISEQFRKHLYTEALKTSDGGQA
jgi:NTP pyrophosphatase (non-canonical NTP hydrolase)